MSQVEAARDETAHDPRIGRMTEHDLLEVVEIEELCGLSRWGWSAYHAELVHGNARLLLVAYGDSPTGASGDDRLAGFVASRLVADELHINNIAVRPSYRRRGLGSTLLRAVLKEAMSLGVKSSLLEVRASNQDAQALYQTCGFRTVGRRTGYYGDPPEDALVMRAAVVEEPESGIGEGLIRPLD
jgi:ribosomal-protein-alanine N-acetyltransferase